MEFALVISAFSSGSWITWDLLCLEQDLSAFSSGLDANYSGFIVQRRRNPALLFSEPDITWVGTWPSELKYTLTFLFVFIIYTYYCFWIFKASGVQSRGAAAIDMYRILMEGIGLKYNDLMRNISWVLFDNSLVKNIQVYWFFYSKCWLEKFRRWDGMCSTLREWRAQ